MTGRVTGVVIELTAITIITRKAYKLVELGEMYTSPAVTPVDCLPSLTGHNNSATTLEPVRIMKTQTSFHNGAMRHWVSMG